MDKSDKPAQEGWRRIRFYLNLNFKLTMCVYAALGIAIISGATWWKDSYGRNQQQLIFQIGQEIQNAAVAGKSAGIAGTLGDKVSGEKIPELLDELNAQHSIGPELLRDVGIALLISVFVTLTIERYASDKLREDIAFDVLSAAYAKIVPESIYRQIAENVFRIPIYRRGWTARIVVQKRMSAHRDACVALIDCEYSYCVENLNEKEISFEIEGAITLDVPYIDVPRFKSINVINTTGKQEALIDVTITAADAKKILVQGAKDIFVKNNRDSPKDDRDPLAGVLLQKKNDEIVFATLVKIPSRESVKVSFGVERAIRVPGTFIIYTPVPANGIEITIESGELEFEIIPLHPNKKGLRHPVKGLWEFEYGILPWQGFQVRCAPKLS